MHRLAVILLVLVGAVVALTASPALATPTPGDCQNDSKLIGPIELSTDYRAGTWWQITKDGFVEAGYVTDADQKALIERFFGTTFATLDDAVAVLVDAVRSLDNNNNNYVCASSTRGTRAWSGDPNVTDYLFGVIDDKHV
jgi:hypothetical protein